MSHSPTEDSSSDELLRYDSGWAATNRMLRAGKSFSGRERNCCFLNLGGTGSARFANVSAATGLDLIDDGRGLALCDWDRDGRLDFWITNRTGPRARFLRNQVVSDNRFVALRLQGTLTNRDAIGARVEVHLGGAAQPPLMKTLYAGSGFLSQSSKWLHFGLGEAGEIDRVVVRWPGGEAEEFRGLAVDRFYRVVQGSGAAVVDEGAAVKIAKPGPPVEEPDSSSAARIVLLSPALMPELEYQTADGDPTSLAAHRGKLVVLNLWATWCANCRLEMREWSKEKEALEAAGLEVLSLCVDESDPDLASVKGKAQEAATALGYPFEIGFAERRAIEVLNVMQKSFVGRQTDLPLPSSLLIDASGRLAVIYKGPVGASQLVADATLLGGDREALLAGATPFQGRWFEPMRSPVRLRSTAINLVESGLREEAARYLRQIIPLYSEKGIVEDEEERLIELAECHTFLAAIQFDDGEFESAVETYRLALASNPAKRAARDGLVRSLLELGREAEALEQVEKLLEGRRDPENLLRAAQLSRKQEGGLERAVAFYREVLDRRPSAPVHYELANLLRDSGDAAAAVEQYRAALTLSPKWMMPANNLAWMLATHPDDEIRDGAEAVRLARIACEASDFKVPHFFGTLAAAQAESGDFPAALESIGRAMSIAEADGDAALAGRLAEKKRFYERGEAFRQQ